MNGETEAEADERLGTETSSSLEKFIASSPHTAVISGVEPTWPDACGNRQRDEQREETSSALIIVEPQGAIEEFGIEKFESEYHGLLEKQAATPERNELTDGMDPWIVDENDFEILFEPWILGSTSQWIKLTDEVDPWIVGVERSRTWITTDEEWSTERRRVAAEQANANAAAKEADEARDHVSSLTIQVEAERARARSLEDEVGRLRRELEAARAGISEADARWYVVEQKMERERANANAAAKEADKARDHVSSRAGDGVEVWPRDGPSRRRGSAGPERRQVRRRLRPRQGPPRPPPRRHHRLGRGERVHHRRRDRRVRAGLLPEPRPFLPHGDGDGGRRGGRRGGGTRPPGSRAGDGVEVSPGDSPSRRCATSWCRRRGRRPRECAMMDDGQAGGWPHDA